MEVSRRALWLLGIAAVLLIVFLGQHKYNSMAEEKQQERLVAICQKSVARDTFVAAGFLHAADEIRERGGPDNIQRAQLYSATAVALARSLPAPAGFGDDPLRLIEVNIITAPDGTERYALTDAARHLQAEGCRHAVEDAG